MKKTKKVLTVFLSLVICISLLPTKTAQVSAAIYNYTIGQAVTGAGDFGEDGYYDFYTFELTECVNVHFELRADSNAYLELALLDEDGNEDVSVIAGGYNDISASRVIYPGKYALGVYTEIFEIYTLSTRPEYTYANKINLTFSKKSMQVGESEQLNYSLKPSNSVARGITWKTGNRNIVSVVDSGEVTAKKLGTTTISAKLTGGNTGKCKINVTKCYVDVAKGKTKSIKYDKKTVGKKWKSGKKKVATVTKSGKIKAVADGKVKLTSKKGGVTYNCIVNVTDYNKLAKKSRKTLKDQLRDPDSLKIYYLYYGYTQDNKPVVVFDYGAKNGYGGMERDYAVGYYNETHKSYVDGVDDLSNLKKLKKQSLKKLK